MTDIDANRVNIITTMLQTDQFLQNIGNFFPAFSIHERGKSYKLVSGREAHTLVNVCIDFLKENEVNIQLIANKNQY